MAKVSKILKEATIKQLNELLMSKNAVSDWVWKFLYGGKDFHGKNTTGIYERLKQHGGDNVIFSMKDVIGVSDAYSETFE